MQKVKQIEKKTRKKESFMQAVLALMVSQVLIKLLGLVYKVYLTNKEGFGDAGNAICNSGYQIYALLLTISSIGVPNAISKLVSERTALGDNKGAHRIFKIAFATFALIGLVRNFIIVFWCWIYCKCFFTNSRSRANIGCFVTINFLRCNFFCN